MIIKFFKKLAVAAAILEFFIQILFTPAFASTVDVNADSGPISNSTPYTDDLNVTVHSGVSVTSSDDSDGAAISFYGQDAGNITFTNNGTISGSTDHPDGVYFSNVGTTTPNQTTFTFNNTGSISTPGQWSIPIFIRPSYVMSGMSFIDNSFNFVLNNSGSITHTTINPYYETIYVTNGSLGTYNITNSGTISNTYVGGGSTYYGGIFLNGGASAVITNSGTIEVIGAGAASLDAILAYTDTLTLNIRTGSNIIGKIYGSGTNTLNIEETISATDFNTLKGQLDGGAWSENIASGGTLNISGSDTVSTLGLTGGTINNSGTLGDLSVSGTNNTLHLLAGSTTGNITDYGSLAILANAADHINVSSITLENSSSILNLGSSTITTTGDFTTASGSTIGIDVSPTTSGSIIASGVANLDSNTKLNISTSGNIAAGSSYVIVSDTSAPITTISDNNINVNNSGLSYSNNEIFSVAASGHELVLNVAALPILNSNQNLVLANLLSNSATVGSNRYVVQQYLDSNASTSSKSNVLNSTMPQVDNSSNRIVFNSLNASLDIASNRLHSIKNHHLGKASGNKGLTKSVWGEISGSNINQGNTSSSTGYNAGIFGITFGADRQAEDDKNIVNGISTSYVGSNINSRTSLGKTNISSYQINAYRGYTFNKYFINNLIGFAWNQYHSNRNSAAANSIAKASYSGQSYIARFEGGLNQKLERGFILTPTVMVTAAHNSVANFTENGANDLDLNVRTKSADFFETRAGLAISNRFTTKNNMLVEPQIFTSYGYDLAGSRQKTSSSFVGQANSFDSAANSIYRGSFKTAPAPKFIAVIQWL